MKCSQTVPAMLYNLFYLDYPFSDPSLVFELFVALCIDNKDKGTSK